MRTLRSLAGTTAPWKELVVDGVRLAYDDAGAGPVVVCLHAIGHGAGDFAPLRARLQQRYRVVAIDWPGQGNSGDDRGPPSAARYAALLEEFLDAAGIGSAVVVGNSIGGSAAIRFAAAHPGRVRALVLANPGGLDRPDALSRAVIGLMVRFFSAGARGARWFRAAFAAYYHLLLTEPAAAEQRTRIVAAAYEIAPLLAAAWRSFGTVDADVRPLLSKVSSPVLVTWATRDRIVQLRRALPAIHRFPDARLARFRAGHAPFLETPDAFAHALEGFLEERVLAAPGSA